MVLPRVVDPLQARSQPVEEVQTLENAQSLARLSGQKLAQEIPFDQLGHKKSYLLSAKLKGFTRVILNKYGEVAKFVEFAGIDSRGASPQIAMGKEKLACAFDVGFQFAQFIDFAFPAASQA
mgnify:FL=1